MILGISICYRLVVGTERIEEGTEILEQFKIMTNIRSRWVKWGGCEWCENRVQSESLGWKCGWD